MSKAVMAAVVIGRNEGSRLETSLLSVKASGLPAVYVDSGSSDGSPGRAKRLGIEVWELDGRRPFSAARARNEGLEEARKRWPDIKYVLFLDGDCELAPAFPAAAVEALERTCQDAIVTGHLLERSPEKSIYNRLCAYEWQSQAGQITDFGALGGIMAARISAIRDVGGFNPDLIAGEDSELGVRLALRGHRVLKIDVPMAVHDADVEQFGQWWRRSVRAGHALAHRYALHGRSSVRDCERQLASTLFWGLLLPLCALSLVSLTRGASLILFGGYIVLAFRIFRHYRSIGLGRSDAATATRFMLYSKFANLLGVLRFGVQSLTGKYRLIEYKQG